MSSVLNGFFGILTMVLYFMWQGFMVSKDFITHKDKGKMLAEKYCSVCHQLPSPADLDKKCWQNYVLPRMKYFCGLKDAYDEETIFERSDIPELKRRGIIMDFSELSHEEWEEIEHYYTDHAPEVSGSTSPLPELPVTPVFSIEFPPLFSSPPSTSLIQYDNKNIWWGDIHSRSLHILDAGSLTGRSMQTPVEGPVNLTSFGEGKLVTFIGNFSPSDDTLGAVYYVEAKNKKLNVPIITGLRRPVFSEVADMNNDHREDILVSEFGKWLGRLSLFIQNEIGFGFEKKVISYQAGCVQTKVLDFNNDGLKDILALFAQGDEHLSIFIQDKQGQFLEKRLIEFPPGYGSIGFEYTDINGDEMSDIVYYNGDLADFPIASKPYQGIHFYLARKGDIYQEEQFLPVSGIYGMKMHDFDLDGDIDIACHSFFPTANRGKSPGFIFFNNENNSYKPFTIAHESKGRWMVMGTGDPDNDGDIDIILGNLIMELPGREHDVDEWVKQGLPFIVLRNQMRR